MAAAVPFAGLGLSAFGSYKSGKDAKKAAKRQAALLEQDAQFQRQKSELEERRFRREASILTGQQEALFGAAGQDLSSATASRVLADTAGQAELDAAIIRMGGDIQSSALLSRASATMAAGRSAARSGLFRAGSTLLTGGSQIYNTYFS